jgi:serine/threonine protein kinase
MPGGGIDATVSPTITSPAMMTGVGMLLGTAAYMSPEQARGKAVDKRSDIWAFGCVLFEMLAGKRAFDGEDVSDTLANVLKTVPDWAALLPGVPSALRALLRRCLDFLHPSSAPPCPLSGLRENDNGRKPLPVLENYSRQG